MSFRLHIWQFITCCIITLAILFWAGDTFSPAQVSIDFTAWKDPKIADNIAERVKYMLERDFRNVTDTAREELLTQTLSALKDIVSDTQVVPSTRYNAILAAGQLVSQPGNPPVAYPPALPYLMAAYQMPDTPHFLKYGALLGIVRHALCGIDSHQRDKVIDILLETVTTEFESGEETLEPAVWNWVRLSALDGLSALKTVGTNNEVVARLLSVIDRKARELEEIGNSQETFLQEHWKQTRRMIELASKAAKTLGDLDYKTATNIDDNKMTDSFVMLTKAVCDVESKIATDAIERKDIISDSALLLEQVVIDLKIGIQSIAWGIRGDLLTRSRPAEHSFYASLERESSATNRLDILVSNIMTLATFFDEGDGTKRQPLGEHAPKAFKFDISELRGALVKCSEALAKMQHEAPQ